MNLLIAFFVSILLGGMLLSASLRYAAKSDGDPVSKALSEMLSKAAVVVFGVFIGAIAFFGQRWLEDVNKDFDAANEALANLDMIQADYMSRIERVYYNNEPAFLRLYDDCVKADLRFQTDDAFCESPSPATVPSATVAAGLDYLDFSPPEDVFDSFTDKIFAQTYLKKATIADLLKKLFDTNSLIADQYGIIVDAVNTIKEKGKKWAGDTKAGATTDSVAHSLCCAVSSIRSISEQIKGYADTQGKAICSIRVQVKDEVHRASDPVIRFLMGWRLKQIDQHVERYQNSPKDCSYTPLTHDR